VNRIVLDTDVASRSFKRLLPPGLLTELIGREASITFVTQAELTKWAARRQWGTLRRERMARWLSRIPVLHSSDDIAAIWGEIAASAERRGRPSRRECCPRGRGAARVVDTFGDVLLVSAVS
jgi:toxin FitB